MLALVAAGCGGGGGGSGGSSAGGDTALPAGASIVPASAPVVVVANSDFSSDQWQKITALFDKFPDGDQLLAQVEQSLNGVKLSDVKDVLGPEVDVAVLSVENGGSAVVMTQPKDKEKLKALLAKSDQPSVTEDVGDWTVVADKQATLDQFDQARKDGTIDGSSSFKDALKEVPSDPAAYVYVNGKAVQDALDNALSQTGLKTSTSDSIGTLDWAVASAQAHDNGVSVAGDAHASLKNAAQSYHPALPDELPSGALAYVSFAHLDQPVEQLYKALEDASPSFKTQLGQAEGLLGFSIENDILPIFSGEGALAVYPSTQKAKGLSVPDIVFVQNVSDESKVRSLIDRLSSLLTVSGSVTVTPTTVAGVSAQKFEYEGITVYAAVFDGKLVVTNSTSVIDGIHGGSQGKLSDDALYEQAADAAGLPSDVLGLVYLNLKDGLPAVFDLAEQTGSTVPKSARDNTAPLQTALFYSTADGNDYRVGGFVTIK